jgi:hypothetical protein
MSDFKPVCTACGSAMTLIGTEPGNPGFDLQVFECPNCHRLQQYVFDSGGTLRCDADVALRLMN